jgi:hypothetical protein
MGMNRQILQALAGRDQEYKLYLATHLDAAKGETSQPSDMGVAGTNQHHERRR